MRFSIRLIGLVSTLILLRLLEPADFGLVAIVTAIAAAIELFRAFGLEIALIQDQDSGKAEYDTVWTMEIIMGAAAGVVMALIAQPAARFYEEPRLAVLFYVMAAANFLDGFRNVGIVDFRKDLFFAREFRFNVAIKVIGFVTTITSAFILRSYWALIIGIVSTKLAGLVLSYLMHSYRPAFSLVAIGKLFHFSKWMFVNNLSIVSRIRGPDFILGKLAGASGLGIYSVAYEISNLPTSELIAPINRALLPGFSKIASDPQRARGAFVKAAAVMALFSMPIAFGVAATAPLIGSVVLGVKWLAAVPLMQLLALAGVVAALGSPIMSALIALGRPHVAALLSLANAVTVIPFAVYFGMDRGALGVAQAVLLVAVIFLPIYFAVAIRFMHLVFNDILTILLRPTIAAVVMYWVVLHSLDITTVAIANLFLAIATGALVYPAVIFATWKIMPESPISAESFLLERYRQRRLARSLVEPSVP